MKQSRKTEVDFELLAQRFDAQWRNGQAPQIGSLLSPLDEAGRLELLKLVIPIDIDHRLRSGQSVDPSIYDSLGEYAVQVARSELSKRNLVAHQTQTRINSIGYVPPTPIDWTVPSSIGPYKLLTKLGEGGMGEVWMADQSEPVKRRVALKLIKRGIGSRETISRFEAERQALALMNHPNIAKILDAGATPEGQPYFAMELVQGMPLTTYCDEKMLGINERLALFIDVCNGVQHAHQKGIIHRDLKPSNILVTLVDNNPVPKIIDFGLAKATESAFRLTDHSMVTNIGQIMGTFKYMSPEQANLDSNDIDTRTDIYALGVILYELLTGSTPLDDPSIRGQAALKVLEYIRDHEPAKPSRQLDSKSEEQRSSITNRRKTDSAQLSRVLAGDLDWVVMKALERDRARRYESASSFAADIGRYLSNEPVIARPPSFNYRVQKFIRKHRVPVLVVGLLFATLSVGIISTTFALLQSRRARAQADARTVELGELTKFQVRQFGNVSLIEMGNQIREQVLQQSESNLQDNGALQDQLKAVNFTDIASEAFAENIIKPALAAIKNDLNSSPQVKAAMLQSVASIAFKVGLTDLCIPPQLEALKIRRELYGSAHAETIESLLEAGLMHQFKPSNDNDYLLQAMEASQRVFGPGDERSLQVCVQLAEDSRQRGKIAEARDLFEQVIERSSQRSPSRVLALRGLGTIFAHGNQPDAAEVKVAEAFELAKSIYSESSSELLSIKAYMAWILQLNQRAPEAEKLYREIYSVSAQTLGDRHPNSIDSLKGLAESLAEQGKFEAASVEFDKALNLAVDNLGMKHQLTLACLSNKARILVELGKENDAKPVFEQALQSSLATFGADHPATLECLSDLGIFYLGLGDLVEAEKYMKQSLDGCSRTFGPQDARTQHKVQQLELINRRKQ